MEIFWLDDVYKYKQKINVNDDNYSLAQNAHSNSAIVLRLWKFFRGFHFPIYLHSKLPTSPVVPSLPNDTWTMLSHMRIGSVPPCQDQIFHSTTKTPALYRYTGTTAVVQDIWLSEHRCSADIGLMLLFYILRTLSKWRPTAYYSRYPPRSIHVCSFCDFQADGRGHHFDLSMTWSVGYSIAHRSHALWVATKTLRLRWPLRAFVVNKETQERSCSRNEKEQKVEDIDENLKLVPLPVEAYSRMAMSFSDTADYPSTTHWRNILEMSLKSAILSLLSEFFTVVFSALPTSHRIIIIIKKQ